MDERDSDSTWGWLHWNIQFENWNTQNLFIYYEIGCHSNCMGSLLLLYIDCGWELTSKRQKVSEEPGLKFTFLTWNFSLVGDLGLSSTSEATDTENLCRFLFIPIPSAISWFVYQFVLCFLRLIISGLLRRSVQITVSLLAHCFFFSPSGHMVTLAIFNFISLTFIYN